MQKVISVKPLDNYRLLAEFSGGEKRICDIKPLLLKPVFSSLSDVQLFNSVYIEYGAVTWKTAEGIEIDICSDNLYKYSIKIT